MINYLSKLNSKKRAIDNKMKVNSGVKLLNSMNWLEERSDYEKFFFHEIDRHYFQKHHYKKNR